jgi:hypothetical protein
MWQRRPRSCAVALAVAISVSPAAALGQAVLGFGEDATSPPRGVIRAEISNTWLRYRDRRFGIGGEEVSLPSLVRPTVANIEVGVVDWLSLALLVPLVYTRVDATTFLTGSDGVRRAIAFSTYDNDGLGDIELRGKLVWLSTLSERERYTPRGFQMRSALTAIARLGTGEHNDPRNPFDIGTGDGQTDVELRSQSDFIAGKRYWMSVVGRYARQLSSRQLVRVTPPDSNPFSLGFQPFSATQKLGDYYELEATPRLVLGKYFLVGAQYLYRHKSTDRYSGTGLAADTLGNLLTDAGGSPITLDASALEAGTAQREQRLSFGFVYSTVAPHASRKARYPFEVSYQHTLSLSARGLRKISQDAIRVRAYVRLWGK